MRIIQKEISLEPMTSRLPSIIPAYKDNELYFFDDQSIRRRSYLYTSNYGKIRQMEQNDIPSVLAIMRPFVENGKLLPRTELELKNTFTNYIVYEIDGAIRACSSLIIYSDGQSEIAAVAVDEAFSHMGIGPKMIEQLISRAKTKNARSIFIMTTQAIDWFEKLGFTEDKIESLPDQRRAKWSPDRNSKVYRLN